MKINKTKRNRKGLSKDLSMTKRNHIFGGSDRMSKIVEFVRTIIINYLAGEYEFDEDYAIELNHKSKELGKLTKTMSIDNAINTLTIKYINSEKFNKMYMDIVQSQESKDYINDMKYNLLDDLFEYIGFFSHLHYDVHFKLSQKFWKLIKFINPTAVIAATLLSKKNHYIQPNDMMALNKYTANSDSSNSDSSNSDSSNSDSSNSDSSNSDSFNFDD